MLPTPIRRTVISASSAHRTDDAPHARGHAPQSDETYVGAFARVRLVRAWIGAAAAMVALGYAFAALLDRVLP